jgi:hypothetical protein
MSCRFAAVMSQVLTHLHPPVARRVFAEAHRVLQEQGVLIVNAVSRHYPGVEGEPGHLHFDSPSELRRELGTAGFDVLIDLNEPRRLLGNGWLGRGVMKALYRTLKWDILSESAAFIAQKRVNPQR